MRLINLKRPVAAASALALCAALVLGSALFHGTASAADDPKGAATSASSEANSAAATNGPEEDATPSLVDWSFTGFFGHFDTAQLQRGFKVYKEVCSNCHSLKFVAFRNLAEPGGPGFSEAQVKALAATYQIHDGPNDQGEMFDRPGRPSDYFPWSFANASAARAALGALPPDMSLLAKARAWERGFPVFILDAFTQVEEAEGPNYIHAILNGYTHADDPNWNLYFPGHKIGMGKPLSDGQVEYTDGSPQTVEQYSQDIAAFLFWAAEPKLEQRKEMGFRVIIFLSVFAVLLYFVKRKIWAKVHGDTAPDSH